MDKKVLYIVYDYYNPGGIGRMLSLKIDAWKKYFGYNVTVVAASQNKKPVFYKTKCDFKLIDCNFQNLIKANILTQIKFCIQLRKIINQEKPDLVVTSFTGVPSLLLPLFTKRYKTYLEIHGSGHHYVTPMWKYKWFFLSKYNGIVLLNEDEKKYYKTNNLLVIPNFIDLEAKAVAKISFDNRKKIVLSAGRIHKEKQIDHLVKIWELVYSRFSDWQLHIYGEGNEIQKVLENYIFENKISNVYFKGVVESIDEKMQEASVFCLTSETEAFGMVLLEAKKNGLPTISYNCENGPRNVISNDGLLINPNDMNAFALSLSELMMDDAKRKILSENAFRNVNSFSAENIIEQWKLLTS